MSELILGPNTNNLKGKSFGRLTVLEYAGKSRHGYALWRCVCVCGQYKIIAGASLTGNLTKSCGCLNREVTGNKRRTHGKSESREHKAWLEMRRRCRDEKRSCYHRYGGRGITICERWSSFGNFLSDMGPCPENYTLERNDTDGNYEPNNCRWASWNEQSRNKVTNHRITFNGETHILVEWAEILGVNPTSLRYRLKVGWTIERTLTEPVKKRA